MIIEGNTRENKRWTDFGFRCVVVKPAVVSQIRYTCRLWWHNVSHYMTPISGQPRSTTHRRRTHKGRMEMATSTTALNNRCSK